MRIVPVAIVLPLALSTGKPRLWMQKRQSLDDLNGLLEFPGGKIEQNETPAQAAQREVLEETGARIKTEDLALFKIYPHIYPDKTVSIYAFLLKDPAEGIFESSGWVDLSLDWRERFELLIPPANLSIFSDLTKEFLN